MCKIEVRELDKREYKIWDQLVELSPNATIFHSSDWLTRCSESFNKKLKIYGCFENDELVCGCSLFVHKLKNISKIASSTCPMTPYGGVIFKQFPSFKVRKQLQEQQKWVSVLCSSLYNEGFISIEITNSPDLLDIRPFKWNKWGCDVFYAYYLDLNKDLYASFSKDVRSNVKKAINLDLQITKINNIDAFYELYTMTFAKHNLKPPADKKFFVNMMDLFESKNCGEMRFMKTPSDEFASSEITIWDNKRAYSWAAASNEELNYTGSTSFLMYDTCQDFKDREFKEINIMSANSLHLAKFASGFNPKLVPYFRVYWNKPLYNLFKTIHRF
ncbi:GNAT family N-acetyltransferase [Methanococcoides sp. LMO-2]|uniref:GNAT family N-acetyltransferase n=1 Tax=Methanococcoides cohabitans TaxID=3136559 RepID=A0ABU9KS12_9EURY